MKVSDSSYDLLKNASSEGTASNKLVQTIQERCLRKIAAKNLATTQPLGQIEAAKAINGWNAPLSEMVSASRASIVTLAEKFIKKINIFEASCESKGIDCDNNANILSWNEIAIECLIELNSLSQDIIPDQSKWIRCWDDDLINSIDLSLTKRIKSCLGHFTYFQQLPLAAAIMLLSEKPPNYGQNFFIIGLISSASKLVPQKISNIKKICDILCSWEGNGSNISTATNHPFLGEKNPIAHGILLLGLKIILTHPFYLDTLWEESLADNPREIAKNYLLPHFSTINKLISIAKRYFNSSELMEIYFELNTNWKEAIQAMHQHLTIIRRTPCQKRVSHPTCLLKRNDPTQLSMTYKQFYRQSHNIEQPLREVLLMRRHRHTADKLLAVVTEMPALFTQENCS